MPAGVGNVIGSAWMKVGVDTVGGVRSLGFLGGAFSSMGINASSALGVIGKFAGVGVGLVALTSLVKKTTSAFIEFDTALHNTWTLLNENWEGMVRIGEQVRALARDYPETAEIAQRAMYQINSAVFYNADAFNILEESMKGAAAGLSDVMTVADMTTTVLNAYGMSGMQASEIMDMLFTAIRYGKTTMPELASQFGRLAGVSAPVGASISDVAAAIATLTRQGLETRWAITSLRQTMMQFIKPTRNLKVALKDLGYESGSLMIKQYGFAESLRMVTKWAKENNVEMDQLFTNIRAVTAVLPLTTTAVQGFADDQERMANSTGAATVAFKKQTEAASFQLRKFWTLLGDLAIEIGRILVPGILLATKVLSFFVDGLRQLFHIINDVIKVMGGMVDTISQFIMKGVNWITRLFGETEDAAGDAAESISTDFLAVATSLKLVREELEDINKELEKTSGYGGLMAGISDMSIAGLPPKGAPTITGEFAYDAMGRYPRNQALAAWNEMMEDLNTDELEDSFNKFYDTVMSQMPDLESALSIFSEYMPKIGENIEIFDLLHERIVNFREDIEDRLKSLKEVRDSLGENAKAYGWVTEQIALAEKQLEDFNAAGFGATKMLKSWQAPLAQAADMIIAGAGQLVDAIYLVADAFKDNDLAGIASGAIGIIQSIVNIFQRWLREERERLEERKKQLQEEKRLQEEMLGFWKESLTGLIGSFGSILSTGLGDILGPLAGVVDTLSNAFSKAIEMTFLEGIDLLRAGMELFNSLITGLTASFMNLLKQADAYSAFQKETSSLWKAIADLFGMFLWPLVALIKALKGMLGIVDETSQELASLNIPAGFKVERIRYAAITPGIPAIGTAAAAVPAWAVAVGDELARAIMRMLERFGISDWTSLLESFKQGSIDFWNYVIANVPAIINSITSIFDIFRNAFGNVSVSTIVDLLKSVVDWFIHDAPAFFAEAVEFFNELVIFAGNVMTWMGKVDWDKLMSDISGAFSKFNTLLGDLPTWTDIKGKIDELITAIGNVEKAIRGIEDVGRTATNIAGGAAIGAGIGTFIPGVGTIAGGVIGGALGWIASLLGFAEGGIVPGPIGAPQLAVVHGGEIITPPPGAFMAGAGGGGDLHVYLELDGKQIANATVENFRDISYRKTGRSYSSVAINER